MASLSPELKKEIFAEGLRDPVYFCRVILAEWFPKAMPWFHRGLLALLTRETDFLLNFGKENWKTESRICLGSVGSRQDHQAFRLEAGSI